MPMSSITTHGEIRIIIEDAEGNALMIDAMDGKVGVGEGDKLGSSVMEIDLHGLKMLKTWLDAAIPNLERLEAFKATRDKSQ